MRKVAGRCGAAAECIAAEASICFALHVVEASSLAAHMGCCGASRCWNRLHARRVLLLASGLLTVRTDGAQVLAGRVPTAIRLAVTQVRNCRCIQRCFMPDLRLLPPEAYASFGANSKASKRSMCNPSYPVLSFGAVGTELYADKPRPVANLVAGLGKLCTRFTRACVGCPHCGPIVMLSCGISRIRQ